MQNASSSEMTGVLKELPAGDVDDDVITSLDAVRDYSDAVTCIHNDGETVESLEQYKAAVKALLLGAAWLQRHPRTIDRKSNISDGMLSSR